MPVAVRAILGVLLCLVCYCAAQTQVKIVANPVAIDGPANVTVTWSGVQDYNAQLDVVSAYLLNDNGAIVILLSSMGANESVAAANGTGQLVFSLQNFRQPMYFEYSRNNTVLGTSNLVQGNATIPQYGHIALTGISGQMRVMWNSGSNASIPTVRYGTNSSLLSLSASGSSSTFSIADTCMQYATQPRQFIDPGFQHDVVLTGLAPSTVYFYQFGNAQEGWSDVLSFTSAPVDGDASQPTRIIATADTGTYVCGSLIQNAESACEPWSQGTFDTIAQALQTYDAGVLLHVGDLAYAVGYQWTWEQFMVAIEPIATQLPYMVGIGNHEYDYLAQPFRPWWSNYMDDANGECGVPYSRRFHMPDVKGSPLSGLWYSFNYGLGHFVFMSTEHNFTVRSPQWNWIVADLAAVNRSVTPWVIFNGHRPMYYTDFLPDPNLVMAYFLRKNLEPVLLKYGVDLALWGHVHVYERTCAINDGACVTDGTGIVHAVIGNGGREIAPVNWSVAPAWSVYREKTFGWARITLTPSTLTFDFIANNDTQVHDSFVISKQ